MMRISNLKTGSAVFTTVLIAVFISVCGASVSEGADGGKTKCRMTFDLSGWSIIYETASGSGAITCDNGQSSRVKLRVKGGGITAGKYKLKGHGEFTDVANISELYGAYGAAEAHAGAVKSADAQVLTKGSVSLAISSKGSGVNLGIAFSGFKIEPAGKKQK